MVSKLQIVLERKEMRTDKTASQLKLKLNFSTYDGSTLPSWEGELPTKSPSRRSQYGDDDYPSNEPNPNWENPFMSEYDSYEDEFLQTPFSLRVGGSSGKVDMDKYAFKNSPDSMLGKNGFVIHIGRPDKKTPPDKTRLSIGFGSSQEDCSYGKVGQIFTPLFKKAGEILERGEVGKDELLQFGNNTVNSGEQSYFDRNKSPLIDTVTKKLIEFSKSKDAHIGNLVQETMRELDPESFEEEGWNDYQNSNFHGVVARTFMSTVTRAIGGHDFINDFLESYEKVNPEAVDNLTKFNGTKSPPDRMRQHLIGMASYLPASSKFYGRLVKNFWGLNC